MGRTAELPSRNWQSVARQSCYLLLTRLISQALPAETVKLMDALQPGDAAELLDSLTDGRVTAAVRDGVLSLLEGHPLALTWAGNLLARGDEDPRRLADDWRSGGLPRLSDPTEARHTLKWLFDRSVRGLDETARRVLSAAGLLARAPFPLAMAANLWDEGLAADEGAARLTLKSLVQSGLLRLTVEADHWEFTHVLGYRFAGEESGSDPVLRDLLARWLSGYLQAALKQGNRSEPGVSLTRLLEHADALQRADDDHRLWESLVKSLLYETLDRLTDLGRLDLMKLAVDSVAEWLGRLRS